MNDDRLAREGVAIGLLAYVLWGLFPVYFKIIESVVPSEVVAHRVIWAVPFGAIIIMARRQWPEVKRAFADKRMLAWLALAALSISINWLIYIWAVQNERIFESSLGYYMNPLMYVVVGVLLLRETLRRKQIIAVVLASIGVAVLTISIGTFPWVAVSLALLFTVYGVIRKQINIGAMPGLFVETLLLLPFALGWLVWLIYSGMASFGSGDLTLSAIILLAGPVTVLPLLFFAISAKRLSMTTIGFMQFVSPTLQFCTALYFGESLTAPHIICFGFIWAAVGFFIVDALQSARKKPLKAAPAGA